MGLIPCLLWPATAYHNRRNDTGRRLVRRHGVESVTITITNNCPYTIWPATLTGGGPTVAQLPNTGFELGQGATSSIDVPAQWSSGRIWARAHCTTDSTGRFTCPVADCATGQIPCNGAGGVPPATLAEFTLGSQGQDTFDVSNVDGFNLPLSIAPQGGAGDRCITTSCGVDINADCPQQLAVRDANGATIGCRSGCNAFNTPQECCTGSSNDPQVCQPTGFSMFFKQRCPQAYSYGYDDGSSTFTCTGGPNYAITFCP
ncbi:hypothetical protein LguiA_013013 [Lonicera macranthoides]